MMAKISVEGGTTSQPMTPEVLKANVATEAAKAASYVPPAPSNSNVPDVAAEPTTRVAANEAKKNAGPPNAAPKGQHWTWVGNEYKLYYDKDLSSGNGGSGLGTGTGAAATGSTTGNATQNLLLEQQKKADADAALRNRQSAYDILYNEFNKYGLGSLVADIKGLIQSNVSPSQFSIELQNTDAYNKRFAANQDRIKAGLSALKPAEYIGMEDQYQSLMRNYGLPASYYSKDNIGTQAGFQKLLANDVSASELEDRIATAQQRVLNTNPEVLKTLKQFYPDLGNADILAYTLDPQNALTNIKRKVTAAEIGGAALAQGLQANGGTAESLAGLGITKAQAQQGYTDVAGMVPRGSQLSDIYGQGPYNQGTAEAEVFNTAGAADAAAKRKKLTALETASFSGQSGVGALGRDKNLYGQAFGQQGQY